MLDLKEISEWSSRDGFISYPPWDPEEDLITVLFSVTVSLV
jgi:hypothetical protein